MRKQTYLLSGTACKSCTGSTAIAKKQLNKDLEPAVFSRLSFYLAIQQLATAASAIVVVIATAALVATATATEAITTAEEKKDDYDDP